MLAVIGGNNTYLHSVSINNNYNKRLRTFANKNRKNMTKAEACLWKYALSKRQTLGSGFRRQRPIYNYIVDFVCLELKLVIEVDGYSHLIQENEINDVTRQEELEGLGYTVLRFSDEMVLKQMNQVRAMIEKQVLMIREEQAS